jgi:nicotinamide-nucleotide amidase
MITAALLPIGEELLSGSVTDTNSSWIAAQLRSIGIPVRFKHTVGDLASDILSSIELLTNQVDILILTGGLGPTRDDVTKKCLLQWSDSDWIQDQATFERIRAYMTARGRTVNDLNSAQALVPSKAKVLPNFQGTAPGLWIEQNNKILISLPGVPYEMKALMEQQVIPLLKSRFDTQLVWEEIVHVGGIPESELAMQLQSFEQNLPEEISIAYLPEPGMVKVKLSLSAAKNEEISARAMLLEQVNKLENILSNAIYAHNTESIESVVFDLLQQSGKTLAIAESCTGGSISSKLVQLPGISSILKGSVVSYSNEVKIEILKVKKSSIELEGSVSQQVAIEMADGVRKLCGADYGLSVTGIAGPDGGSPEKPVGTVWIGLSSEQGNEAFSFLFEANRARNIQRSVLMALILLRKKHLGILGDAAN